MEIKDNKMAQNQLDRDTYFTVVRDVLKDLQEEATAYNEVVSTLRNTLNNDVTFASLDVVRKFTERQAISRKAIQNLEKCTKARAYARLNGK